MNTAALWRSRAWQAVAVVLAFTSVALWNWRTDGLWFQGDAPRHAANGLFWWDLLTTLPLDPVGFAVSYYARYPVIAPATYPPLFYFVEGLLFAVVGPVPYAARVLVLVSAVAIGLYTMAWCRRWIGPGAGWAGAVIAFLPGMVLWSNAVMLNVPATALGFAGLFHVRRWLEDRSTRQLTCGAACLAAVVLTYYPGATAVFVAAAWVGCFGSIATRFSAAPGLNVPPASAETVRARRAKVWGAIAVAAAALPLAVTLFLTPAQAYRHLSAVNVLANPASAMAYGTLVPALLGLPVVVLGLLGGALALMTARWRSEGAYLAIWMAVVLLVLSMLRARDARYALLLAPAFVIAAATGIAILASRLPSIANGWRIGAVAVGLVAGFWTTTWTTVPSVTGFRELAAYLRDHAAADAVLYEGPHDGLFGFWVRALDPHFERRVVLGSKLIYQQDLQPTFEWRQVSNVAAASDVAPLLRARCGCRWIAIEATDRVSTVAARRMLREALEGPEFSFVQAFPIEGAGTRRVDLYRLNDPIGQVTAMDLTFPSLSAREYQHVRPVSR